MFSNIKANIDNGEIDKLISEDEGAMISANFYEALTGMNISEQDTGSRVYCTMVSCC